LFEINKSAFITESAHSTVSRVFSTPMDERMGNKNRIVVIATGFEQSHVARKME